MRRFPITLDTREATRAAVRREVEGGARREVASQTEWALDPSKVYRAVVERERSREVARGTGREVNRFEPAPELHTRAREVAREVARGAGREVARKAPRKHLPTMARSVGVPWLDDSFMAEELLSPADPAPEELVRGEGVKGCETGMEVAEAAMLPATLACQAMAEPPSLATGGQEAAAMARMESEALVAGLEEIVMETGEESTMNLVEGKAVMSTKEEEANILARKEPADIEAREGEVTKAREEAAMVEEEVATVEENETILPDNAELVMGILAEGLDTPPADILTDIDMDWLDINSNIQEARVGAWRGDEVLGVGAWSREV